MSREIPPAFMVTQEWLDKLEKRLEKLERGQALSQYFFKLLSEQNKDLLQDVKSMVKDSEKIIEACGKFEELIAQWNDDHPLMKQAEELSLYLEKSMERLTSVTKQKNS